MTNMSEGNVSALYAACQNGDFLRVEQLLHTLSVQEINLPEENGNTCLHAACSSNHPQIVKLLLDHGAVRNIVNKQGHTPSEEMNNDQIKQLFPRINHASQARFSTDILPQAIEWVSSQGAVMSRFNQQAMNNKDVVKGADSIQEDERFRNIRGKEEIDYFLEQARLSKDPIWLIKAYSAETGFYGTINKALAQGKSDFIRSPLEGFHSLVGCFFHHDSLKQYRYAGKTYRGMKLSQEDFDENYRENVFFLVKPFTSTSKNRNVSEKFATAPSDDATRPLSVLLIYTMDQDTLTDNLSIALDISSMSEYPEEEEVLILPHTSFQIQTIKHLPSGLIEIVAEYIDLSFY